MNLSIFYYNIIISGINELKDEGTKVLATNLIENNSISSLSLELNQIGDEGGKAIAELIQKGCSLKSINLGSLLLLL